MLTVQAWDTFARVKVLHEFTELDFYSSNNPQQWEHTNIMTDKALFLLTHMHLVIVHPVFNGWKCWPASGDTLRNLSSGFVHPVEGDGNSALHFCPGDLGQVLGVQDEEVSWSLGAGSHHDGQQDSWEHISTLLVNNFNGGCWIKHKEFMLLTYHHPHPPHREFEQTGALRGRSLALATPRSPWSSRSTCRSTHK